MRRRSRKKPKRNFFLLSGLILVVIICLVIFKNANAGSSGALPAYMDESANTDKTFIVTIDPGHGGNDSGTISSDGIMEKDINLKVALRLGKILEKSGLKVVYTRTDDETPNPKSQKADLQARCDISNNADANIFVSIHSNFDEVSTKTRGIETWCILPGAKGETLAKSIQKELTGLGYSNDRGIKYESDGGLYVLKNTNAVAVLVELGFLSNKSDTSFLKSKKGQEKIANAIAKGIFSYSASN